ncbi:MAG: hypothetical protein IT436_06640 [Phycisphaerales bacterium]|nr:hypothetical protein [Phycisphaerales bacterium]
MRNKRISSWMGVAAVSGLMACAGQAWADPCSPADLNGDGLVDFSDYLEFLTLYDAQDLRVDYTGDGMVDFTDYLEFLNLYEAGCLPACSPLALELASNPLASYPNAEFVQAYLNGSLVSVTVDPFKCPDLTGKTTNVYITTNRTWALGDALTDVRGAAQSVNWPGGSVAANTFSLTGSSTLPFDAGEDLGIGYDLVIDENNNGVYDGCDKIDGVTAAAGFYKVRDMTTANAATAVTQINTVSIPAGRTTAGWEDERWYYPTNIASRGQIPLVLISHGNGHNYTWYDFLGQHLASYGMIVVSHENNTGPGIASCKITQLDHMNTLVALQGSLAAGILNGHIDINRLYTIGHSRGGDGVAALLDDLFDGTYNPTGGFPRVISFANYAYSMSIAPTDFLGTTEGNPHTAAFHLIYGAADGDVCGCASSDIADSFNISERAEQRRMVTYLQGVGHNEFNCCGFADATGPALIGRPAAQAIQKAYTLAGMKYLVGGNVPSGEVLWRQYERFRPIGSLATAVVDSEFKEFGAGKKFVIDDFQDADNLAVSSSGAPVAGTVVGRVEGPRFNDINTAFTYVAGEAMNGMTRGRSSDTTDGTVFEYDSTVASRDLTFDVAAGGQDTTPWSYLSFRSCQRTRNPLTTALIMDQVFEVELQDGAGNTSRIRIDAYGGGIEEVYQRTGEGTGTGWQNEFETIRIRLSDFCANGRTLDLTDVRKVRFLFGSSHGTNQGALALDDIEFSN